MDLETKRMVFLGSKMISHYGCYACHLIPGYETASRPGTELTTWAEKPISQLDFAFFSPAFKEMREEKPQEYEYIYPQDSEELITLAHGNDPQEVTHTHASFAYHKMRNPRIWDRNKIKRPYDKLKMPNFYLSETEADALVTYLLGRRAPRVADSLKIDYETSNLGAIADGRLLTRQLNCVGCHQIEDNVATAHQYFRTVIGGSLYFDEVNAPPNLRGEGAKVQHWWLAQFFHNVEMLRPWLKIRMPSFDLTTEQSETLVRYFAALSNYESEELAKHLKPVMEYVHAQGESAAELADEAARAEEDPGAKMPPGSDWFRMYNHARNRLGAYSLENRVVGPYELREQDNTDERLAEAYAKVLDGTTFLRDLYDVPYPFDRSAQRRITPERFENGEAFMLELGCLKCHVLGDPNVEGSNPNPTAPNLDLTFSRLRPEWVDYWLRNPAWIQPGTKMPKLFPSAEGAFVDYGDLRTELEARFGGSSDEQIQLLIDYLYDAGQRRHTAIQPGLVFTQPADSGDEFMEEGGEFEEEEFFDEE
jgi:hypothetical protein